MAARTGPIMAAYARRNTMDITKLLNLKSMKIRTQVLTVVAVALLGYAAIGVVYYVSNVKQ